MFAGSEAAAQHVRHRLRRLTPERRAHREREVGLRLRERRIQLVRTLGRVLGVVRQSGVAEHEAQQEQGNDPESRAGYR